MVECECGMNPCIGHWYLVLIDTWWNVNTLPFANCDNVWYVLIDTWWNVNYHEYEIIYSQYVVLIDTWWNVNNGLTKRQNQRSNCFNRYMVECEFVRVTINIGFFWF